MNQVALAEKPADLTEVQNQWEDEVAQNQEPDHSASDTKEEPPEQKGRRLRLQSSEAARAKRNDIKDAKTSLRKKKLRKYKKLRTMKKKIKRRTRNRGK